MVRQSLGLALAALAGLGGWWQQGRGDPLTSTSPPATLTADPADSLYREARDALNRRDYLRAARLFAAIPDRYPRSGYAGDALYWQAFSLYRLGEERSLRDALRALTAQRDRYPRAATQGDAAALERRIQGELARRGDNRAAEDIAQAAEAAVPVPPEPPTPPRAPVPPAARRAACADEDDDMKVAALNALQQMGDERARPILRRVLARRDPASVCLRRKAVFLIAQEGAAGTEEILLDAARTDPDPEVKEQAVFWLSQVGTDRAVSALDSILHASSAPALQEKALFALSQHESPRAQQALRAYAERADVASELREKAIFWIGQSDRQDDAAFLRGLYGKLQEPELKKKVLFSISQMGGQDNGRWLLGIARDQSQRLELRKQALFWAGQGGVSIADLAALYGQMPDREMREQLIFVYSQREEPAATDKLLEIARKKPDLELRKRALFWLGQTQDPRAAKALQDIIEQP
jgi:HEAT repeat protein